VAPSDHRESRVRPETRLSRLKATARHRESHPQPSCCREAPSVVGVLVSPIFLGISVLPHLPHSFRRYPVSVLVKPVPFTSAQGFPCACALPFACDLLLAFRHLFFFSCLFSQTHFPLGCLFWLQLQGLRLGLPFSEAHSDKSRPLWYVSTSQLLTTPWKYGDVVVRSTYMRVVL